MWSTAVQTRRGRLCQHDDMDDPRSGVPMGVSKNSGTSKLSILIGFSIINHPFWDTMIFGKHPYHVDLKHRLSRLLCDT